MRMLRGLHVEDCYLTYRVVQGVFKSQAHLQLAESREKFLNLAPKTQTDFLIIDGDIPGWSLDQYVADLQEIQSLPIFVFSGSPHRRLGALSDLNPKAVLRKEDGPAVLFQAVLSYFYASERFNFSTKMPKYL